MWICGLYQFYKHWVEKYTLLTKQNKVKFRSDCSWELPLKKWAIWIFNTSELSVFIVTEINAQPSELWMWNSHYCTSYICKSQPTGGKSNICPIMHFKGSIHRFFSASWQYIFKAYSADFLYFYRERNFQISNFPKQTFRFYGMLAKIHNMSTQRW